MLCATSLGRVRNAPPGPSTELRLARLGVEHIHTFDAGRRVPMPQFPNPSISRRQYFGASFAILGASLGRVKARSNPVSPGEELQVMIDEACASSRELVVPAGVVVCRRPLLVGSGLRMRLSAGAVLVKRFSNEGGTRGSLVRNRDFRHKIYDVEITGPGTLRAHDHHSRGNILGIWGDRVTLSGWSVDCFAGGRAVLIAGDHWRVSGLTISGSPSESGNGGIRVLGGHDNVVSRCDVTAGDDAFQFVPAASPVDPVFDQSISNSSFVNCRGASTNARLMIAALIRPGHHSVQPVLTASITDCTFANIRGTTSDVGALSVLNSSSAGAISGLLVRDCDVQVVPSGSQAALAGSVYLSSRSLGGITGATLRRVGVRNQPQAAVVVNGHVSETRLIRCNFGRDVAGRHPVAILGGRGTRSLGTRFDGAGATRPVVEVRRLGGTVSPQDVALRVGTAVTGIGTGSCGVMLGASARTRVVGTTFDGDPASPSVQITRNARHPVLRANSLSGPVVYDS